MHKVNIYRTKSSLFITDSQTQKFILEVILIIQLLALENKTEIKVIKN